MHSNDLIISSEKYDPAFIQNIFSSKLKERFQKFLDEECKDTGNISRAQAVMGLGLSPVFKLLPKKEEQDLRSRCERDFKTTCDKLNIPYDKKRLKILSDKLPPDVEQEFNKAKETLKFDEFDAYRRLRAPLLELEAILGFMVSRGIVQGYSMIKGPGGGITSKSSFKKKSYPEGFLLTLEKVLGKLLPVRKPGDPIVCVSCVQITKEMGINWIGSEFENCVRSAIKNKDIPGFDSKTGIKGGIYRLDSSQVVEDDSSYDSDEDESDEDDSTM